MKDKQIFNNNNNNNISFLIRDGKCTSLWHDPCLHKSILRQLIHGPLTQIDSIRTVSGIIDTTLGIKTWNLISITFQIPQNVLDQVTSIAIPNYQLDANDGISWNAADHGEFTLKIAYNSQILKNP